MINLITEHKIRFICIQDEGRQYSVFFNTKNKDNKDIGSFQDYPPVYISPEYLSSQDKYINDNIDTKRIRQKIQNYLLHPSYFGDSYCEVVNSSPLFKNDILDISDYVNHSIDVLHIYLQKGTYLSKIYVDKTDDFEVEISCVYRFQDMLVYSFFNFNGKKRIVIKKALGNQGIYKKLSNTKDIHQTNRELLGDIITTDFSDLNTDQLNVDIHQLIKREITKQRKELESFVTTQLNQGISKYAAFYNIMDLLIKEKDKYEFVGDVFIKELLWGKHSVFNKTSIYIAK